MPSCKETLAVLTGTVISKTSLHHQLLAQQACSSFRDLSVEAAAS